MTTLTASTIELLYKTLQKKHNHNFAIKLIIYIYNLEPTNVEKHYIYIAISENRKSDDFPQ